MKIINFRGDLTYNSVKRKHRYYLQVLKLYHLVECLEARVLTTTDGVDGSACN